MEEKELKLEEDAVLFEHIRRTGKPFYINLSILVAVILWAVWAYLHQYRHGLGVTGLARPIFWGVYITNFVFFIGISHAGDAARGRTVLGAVAPPAERRSA